MKSEITISLMGTKAVLILFKGQDKDEIYSWVSSLAIQLEGLKKNQIADVVIAYDSVVVQFYSAIDSLKAVKDMITEAYRDTVTVQLMGKRHLIPICYAKKYALDLDELTTVLNITFEELIKTHFSKEYRVYMVGFLPGFPYLGFVDDTLITKRKAIPRSSVPTGSVGLAGNQSGIYPQKSPGGWNIIGRTPIPLVDKLNNPPYLFSPGDTVKFYAISEEIFQYLIEGE